MANNDYTITAVVKSLKVLKLFNASRKEMTLTELSKLSGLTKSSTLRILESLLSERFVRYDEETRKYMLGISIYNLANTAYDFIDIRKICSPYLKQAAKESQLLIHLAIIEDGEIIVIDKVWPTEHLDMVALVSYIGGTVPVHCTGVGKVLTAYASEKTKQKLIENCDFKVYSKNTIDNRETFIKTLDEVKTKGYAFNDCEHGPYLRCLTRPIFNSEGKVIAAVSLSGLKDVMTDEQLPFYNSISLGLTKALSREFGYYN